MVCTSSFLGSAVATITLVDVFVDSFFTGVEQPDKKTVVKRNVENANKVKSFFMCVPLIHEYSKVANYNTGL